MKRKYIMLTLLSVFFTSLYLNSQTPTFGWVKQMGGSGADIGRSITTDINGNIYSTGYFEGIADFDPGPKIMNLTSLGDDDIFIQKLDAKGNLLWVKQMGGPGTDVGRSITTDVDGNVYTVGWFNDKVDFDPGPGILNLTSLVGDDIFIQKLDANGNFIWAKQMVGTGNVRGRSITTDADGNVYTTGNFNSTIDFDPGVGTMNLTSLGNSDIYIQKLDSKGNLAWAKQMGGTSSNSYAKSITTDANGYVFSTGVFTRTVDFDPGVGTMNLTSVGSADIFIQKLDSKGNLAWAKQMGGTSSDHGNSITSDAKGNVYTIGFFNATVDFDPGSGTTKLTAVGSLDIFIQKLDARGNFLWVKQMGGTGKDRGESITTDVNGNIYSIGYFEGIADFDPGPKILNLTSLGDDDIFIQKLDPNGSLLWVVQMGGSGTDIGHSITTDAYGNVYTTGDFNDTADFDPGIGTTELTAIGSYDIFIHKLSQCLMTTATDVITACNVFTWIDGKTYTASNNTAMKTIMNARGCDSVITLNLTINIVSDISTTLRGPTIGANNASATYVWLDCDNNNSPIAGETNQTFTADINGNYAVELTENGCVDTSACVEVSTVGVIENSLSNKLIVYPNPTSGSILIKIEGNHGSLNVKLLSISGQVITNQRFQSANSIRLELNQPKGIYMLELTDEQNNKAVIKLVKE